MSVQFSIWLKFLTVFFWYFLDKTFVIIFFLRSLFKNSREIIDSLFDIYNTVCMYGIIG